MNNTTLKVDPFCGRTLSTLSDTTVCSRKDNSDSLFEISPKHFFIFGTNEDIKSKSKASSSLKGTASEVGLAVIVGNKLLIFDKDLEKPLCSVPFEHGIDFVVWRRSLLLLGTSASELVLLCPTTFSVKEKVRVNPNCDTLARSQYFVNGFIHSNVDPKCIDMFAIDVHGRRYCFDNVPLSVGSLDMTMNANTSLDIDFGSMSGTIAKRFMEDEHHELINNAESPTRDMLFTSDVAGRICLFELEKSYNEDNLYSVNLVANILEEYDLDSSVKVKRIVDREGIVFLLLSNGKLLLVDEENLSIESELILPSPSFIVHDFSVICSRMGIKLWTIFGAPQGLESYVGIFSGPSFNLEFSLKITTAYEEGFVDTESPRSYLFPSTTSSYEEPFAFLEIYSNCCRVYKMAETSTDATIQKLLTKGRFDEAEQLTRQYGKDMDVVYKAKVRARVLEIFSKHGTATTKCLDSVVIEVLETLTEIKDAEFVCSFCLEHQLPQVNWFKDILNTGMNRAIHCNATEAAKQLLLTRKKFYTFEQVMSTETIEEWNEFNNEMMYSRSLLFLQNFEFQKCEVVWRRHSDEFMDSISLMDFVPFFMALFSKVLSSPESVSLFRVIFVDAIEKCIKEEDETSPTPIGASQPETSVGLNGMVQLVAKQILSLERELDWPKGALYFVNNLIATIAETASVFEKTFGSVDGKLTRKRAICASIMDHLKRFLQVLNELAELKSSHSIRIAFNDYTRDSRYDVVNSMLNELFIQEEIERFISKFLFPFASRENLILDDLFECHVKAVMLDLPYFISSTDIPYQERIVTLISYISSSVIQLRCVLLIAMEWPVPWSTIIDNMVSKTLQLKIEDDHDCFDMQKKIKILRDQVPFRCLLIKHRLTAAKVRKSDGLHMALRRILKHKKANYMEDCFELIRHSDIFTEEDVLVMKFMLTLENNEGNVEDNIPSGSTSMLKQILYRLHQHFRCIDAKGITGFPPDLYMTEQDWETFSLATKIVASKLNHTPTLEFLKLRKLVPDLWDVDKPYSADYPFSILPHYLPQCFQKSSSEIIADCRTLGDITFHHSTDILAAAAIYFQSGKDCSLEKWWDIVTAIVKTPDLLTKNNPITENAAYNIARLLIQQCPNASDEQMEIIHDFLVLYCTSFDKMLLHVSKLFGIHRIFSTLREQEIPLEKEFLYIYNCYQVGSEDDGEDDFFVKLEEFGTTLLKFGEVDLFNSVFTTIQKEYMELAMLLGNSSENEELRQSYLSACDGIKQLQWDLFNIRSQFNEEESNTVINELLDDLREVGITLNAYALRKRSKLKLLDKLIEMRHYDLASGVALFFGFKEKESWSRILQGFLSLNDAVKLRKVLESIKNTHELWMLPEFAMAWLAVSRDDPGFKSMCPIPLL